MQFFRLFCSALMMVFCSVSWAAPLGGDNIIELQVTGTELTRVDGSQVTVPTGAIAASVNITVVNPSAPGFITVWPCTEPRPLASNLNFVAGDIRANGVIAPLDTFGRTCFYASQTTDFIVDVSGYVLGDNFIGSTPTRLVDSRVTQGHPASPVQPDSPVTIPIAGLQVNSALGQSETIPSSVTAAALNVTVVNPVGAGFVTVYPCDQSRPNSSNVNYVPSQTVANGVIAPVASTGDVCVFTNTPADVVVDIAGWFVGDRLTGTTPIRLADTREGSATKIGGANELMVSIHNQIAEVGSAQVTVPTSASAASLNITAVDPVGAGFVTVYPCGTTRPLASTLNFVAGETVANNAIATVGPAGSICAFSSVDAHIIVDFAGWLEESISNGYLAVSPLRLVDTRIDVGPIPGLDTDGDGLVDAIDSDDDNDMVADVSDAFPLLASESVDTDGDGIGNVVDTDDDNDGVLDVSDALPRVSRRLVIYQSSDLGSDTSRGGRGFGAAVSTEAYFEFGSDGVTGTAFSQSTVESGVTFTYTESENGIELTFDGDGMGFPAPQNTTGGDVFRRLFITGYTFSNFDDTSGVQKVTVEQALINRLFDVDTGAQVGTEAQSAPEPVLSKYANVDAPAKPFEIYDGQTRMLTTNLNSVPGRPVEESRRPRQDLLTFNRDGTGEAEFLGTTFTWALGTTGTLSIDFANGDSATYTILEETVFGDIAFADFIYGADGLRKISADMTVVNDTTINYDRASAAGIYAASLGVDIDNGREVEGFIEYRMHPDGTGIRDGAFTTDDSGDVVLQEAVSFASSAGICWDIVDGRLAKTRVSAGGSGVGETIPSVAFCEALQNNQIGWTRTHVYLDDIEGEQRTLTYRQENACSFNNLFGQPQPEGCDPDQLNNIDEGFTRFFKVTSFTANPPIILGPRLNTLSANEGVPVDFNVLDFVQQGDLALDMSSITVTQPLNGTVSLNSDTGVITYTGNVGGSSSGLTILGRNDLINFQISDVEGNTSSKGAIAIFLSP